MIASILANWLAWSLQVLILSAVGYLAPRLLRVTDPKSRLLGAQFTLAVCLILPFASPRLPLKGSIRTPAAQDNLRPLPGRRVPARRTSPWQYAIPAVLAAGALLRLGGLTAGLFKLRAYRRSSRQVEPDAAVGPGRG